MKRAIWMCKVLALVAAAITPMAAQQSGQDKKAPAPEMQVPVPGPEMDRMKFLIGTWDLKGAYEKTPVVPQGGAQTGWYKAWLGPGGFSILAEFEADGPLGKEIGHQVIAWDPKQNLYTLVTVGNNFPGAIIGTSRWEGANLVTRSEFSEGGTLLHLRSAYSNIQEKSVHMEEFFQAGDGPEQLLWKADATKQSNHASTRIRGDLAHAWAGYDARFGELGKIQEWSGIDAFTLMKHEGRWRIVSLAFEAE